MMMVLLTIAQRPLPLMSASYQYHCQRVKLIFAEGEQCAGQTQSNLWSVTSFRPKLFIITRAEGGKEDASLTIMMPTPKLHG